MEDKIKNPVVTWKIICEKTCLQFTFRGVLTREEALVAIEEWRNCFASKKSEKITIIWQCLEMKGYEAMARVVWQKAIKDMKEQIDTIWLVTESSIIQAGAKIMSLFTSYEIKVAKSEAEIAFEPAF